MAGVLCILLGYLLFSNTWFNFTGSIEYVMQLCCFDLLHERFVMQILFRHYSSLEVASEYFRSGADKISIGSDAVYAAEEYLRTGVSAISIVFFIWLVCMVVPLILLELFAIQVKTGNSSLEQISKVYGNQVTNIDCTTIVLIIHVFNPGIVL